MSTCDQDCRYDAVHGTTRCLQHWDPTQRAAPINAPARHVQVAEPATFDPYAEVRQVMPAARSYLKPALATTVGFDEPLARGWLARAIGRILR